MALNAPPGSASVRIWLYNVHTLYNIPTFLYSSSLTNSMRNGQQLHSECSECMGVNLYALGVALGPPIMSNFSIVAMALHGKNGIEPSNLTLGPPCINHYQKSTFLV